MKQVTQNLRTGKVELQTVPAPAVGRGEVLVHTRASLISAGTERMMMDFAGKSLAGKAKERPDLVRKVMHKMQRDGVVDTLSSVFARLDEPMPLGYSAAGIVTAVGADCAHKFKVGDRVAIAGAALANHAHVNAVPHNLCVSLPSNVMFEHGCYATLGAIALHGVHNAGVEMGSRVLVVGLGLVGQLVTQLAAAAGARVAGVDFNSERTKLAKQGGAQWAGTPAEVPDMLATLTQGRGFDSILLCAATESDAPIAQAADWARDRATVILVGKVGTGFPYAAYMKKELTVRVSRSYGPGRYDPAFEQKGMAYPTGFVPWTEKDNLAEVVRLMGLGRLNVGLLTSHTFPFEDALKGYDLLAKGQPCLGVVLAYPEVLPDDQPTPLASLPKRNATVGISLIGVGGFARSVVLPALKGVPFHRLQGVISKGGLSAAHAAQKYGAAYADTKLERVLTDASTDAVMVLTRHNAHAAQVLAALKAGKHVWVEKPLALTHADITAIESAAQAANTHLMVGFNRRYSPALVPLRHNLARVNGPKHVLVRVNAGRLEEGGWQQSDEGGGRLLGEVCHFTDLALWLIGSPLQSVRAVRGAGQDDYVVTLMCTDGSLATVFYTSEGDPAAPKERVEVFGGGCVGIMENYTRTTWSSHGRTAVLYKKPLLKGQQKGHAQALAAFVAACRGRARKVGSGLPPVAELCFSSRIPLWAMESLEAGGVAVEAIPPVQTPAKRGNKGK
jgi:predicted dehydrogenase/threonine dehydrogenase-like Zn-dependent dehydrogenase